MTLTRALAFLLILSITTVWAAEDVGPRGPTVDSVLSLLTDPKGFDAHSRRRLKRQGEARYGLWALGDDASAVLVEAGGEEERGPCFIAARLLSTFGDASVREPLRSAFIVEPDSGARAAMARAMASLFPVAAADMLVDSLADTPATNAYDNRIQQLLALHDARVVPHVRAFGADEAARDTARAFATLCRVEAGDRDAIPLLLGIHEVWPAKEAGSTHSRRQRVIAALAAMEDERAITVALETMRSSRDAISASPLPRVFGSRLVPHLLGGVVHAEPTYLDGLANALKAVHAGERQKGWDGVPPRAEHVDLYGAAFLDASYGDETRSYDRADATLRRTIAEMLASLGDEGREYLRQGVHTPHSHREALTALASYNDIATLVQ